MADTKNELELEQVREKGEAVFPEKAGTAFPADLRPLETVSQSEKQKKAQRSRSVALGIALALFVLLVYVGTWAKLGANLFIRPL